MSVLVPPRPPEEDGDAVGCQRGRVKCHRSRSVATGGCRQLPADRATLSSMSRSCLVTAGRAEAPAGCWPPARQTKQLPPPCRGPRGPPQPRPFPRVGTGGTGRGGVGQCVGSPFPAATPAPGVPWREGFGQVAPRGFVAAGDLGGTARSVPGEQLTRQRRRDGLGGGGGVCQGTHRRHSARDPRRRVCQGCLWHHRRLLPPNRGPSRVPWGATRRCQGWVAVPVALVASPRPGLGRVTLG